MEEDSQCARGPVASSVAVGMGAMPQWGRCGAVTASVKGVCGEGALGQDEVRRAESPRSLRGF